MSSTMSTKPRIVSMDSNMNGANSSSYSFSRNLSSMTPYQKLLWASDFDFESAVQALDVKALIQLVGTLQQEMATEQKKFDDLSKQLEIHANSLSLEHKALSTALCISQMRLAQLCTRNMRCFALQVEKVREKDETKSAARLARSGSVDEALDEFLSTQQKLRNCNAKSMPNIIQALEDEPLNMDEFSSERQRDSDDVFVSRNPKLDILNIHREVDEIFAMCEEDESTNSCSQADSIPPDSLSSDVNCKEGKVESQMQSRPGGKDDYNVCEEYAEYSEEEHMSYLIDEPIDDQYFPTHEHEADDADYPVLTDPDDYEAYDEQDDQYYSELSTDDDGGVFMCTPVQASSKGFYEYTPYYCYERLEDIPEEPEFDYEESLSDHTSNDASSIDSSTLNMQDDRPTTTHPSDEGFTSQGEFSDDVTAKEDNLDGKPDDKKVSRRLSQISDESGICSDSGMLGNATPSPVCSTVSEENVNVEEPITQTILNEPAVQQDIIEVALEETAELPPPIQDIIVDGFMTKTSDSSRRASSASSGSETLSQIFRKSIEDNINSISYKQKDMDSDGSVRTESETMPTKCETEHPAVEMVSNGKVNGVSVLALKFENKAEKDDAQRGKNITLVDLVSDKPIFEPPKGQVIRIQSAPSSGQTSAPYSSFLRRHSSGSATDQLTVDTKFSSEKSPVKATNGEKFEQKWNAVSPKESPKSARIKFPRVLPSVQALRSQFESRSKNGVSVVTITAEPSVVVLPSSHPKSPDNGECFEYVAEMNRTKTIVENEAPVAMESSIAGAVEPKPKEEYSELIRRLSIRRSSSEVVDLPQEEEGSNETDLFMPRVKRQLNASLLVSHLYRIDAPVKIPNNVNYINMEGYLEKLPAGRKKATYWNAWRKRFFQLSNGTFTYYQLRGSDKPSMTLNLMGGNIDCVDSTILGIDDGKGHYVVVRCSSEMETARWKQALISQTAFNPSAGSIAPVRTDPSLFLPALLVDLGGCSIRAGVLCTLPTLPQLYFPAVCATNKQSGVMLYGNQALNPLVRSQSTLSWPLRPNSSVNKYALDSEAMVGFIRACIEQLYIEVSHCHLVVISSAAISNTLVMTINRVLQEKLPFKSVQTFPVAPAALTAYTSDRTGLSVHLGERIEVVPIIDGYAVESGVSRLPYGGARMHTHAAHFMSNTKPGCTEAETLLTRHATEQLCYFAVDYKQEVLNCNQNTAGFVSSVDLTSYDATHSHITMDYGRFQAPDGIFQPELWGLDHPGIHKLVARAITECGLDIRKHMARSIYLDGGVTCMDGFAERLQVEVEKLIPVTLRPLVHASPHRLHTAYIGACALAKTILNL